MGYDARSIFLNVPYDKKYEKLFIALVGSIICVNLTPRCVLEIPERGEGRLLRINSLINECGISLHDLCRVGTPVRFNMPFELGLACAANCLNPNKHGYVLMEAKQHRVTTTLSDLNGRDPIVHGNTQSGIINGVLDVFEVDNTHVDYDEVLRLVRRLQRVAIEIKRKRRLQSIFTRQMFKEISTAALLLADDQSLRAFR